MNGMFLAQSAQEIFCFGSRHVSGTGRRPCHTSERRQATSTLCRKSLVTRKESGRASRLDCSALPRPRIIVLPGAHRQHPCLKVGVEEEKTCHRRKGMTWLTSAGGHGS